MKKYMLLLFSFVMLGCGSSCGYEGMLGSWKSSDEKIVLALNADGGYYIVFENAHGAMIHASGRWEFNSAFELVELHGFPVRERYYYQKGFSERSQELGFGVSVIGVEKGLGACFLKMDDDLDVRLNKF